MEISPKDEADQLQKRLATSRSVVDRQYIYIGLAVAPNDHISVGVDHFRPSKASGLRKIAAPIGWAVPRGSVSKPTFQASPTRYDVQRRIDATAATSYELLELTTVGQLGFHDSRTLCVKVEEYVVWFDV